MGTTVLSRDLRDGLILRWATVDDGDRIAVFNAQSFREEQDQVPNSWDSA